MGIENKKVNVDIDGDGKPDLNLDLKTIIMVVGGIISLTMTYSTLTKQIELNKQEIEVAKTKVLDDNPNVTFEVYPCEHILFEQ